MQEKSTSAVGDYGEDQPEQSTKTDRIPCSPQHLSGVSVDEVVRDKEGCRPRANSTDGELNLPQRGLCDERLVLQSYRWADSVVDQKLPKGLTNLGNTCFLNATLQCLAYLPPFVQSLLSIENKTVIRNVHNKNQLHVSNYSKGKVLTLTVQNLFRRLHNSDNNGSSNGKGTVVSPTRMVEKLTLLNSYNSQTKGGYKFRPGRQEDAHEFLVHLLDAMNDGELRESGINPCKSGWRDQLPIPRLDQTTFVHRVFGGYFRSQVRCRRCGYKSNTYDPFFDLSLEVSRKSCSSLTDALQHFTQVETLDSNNTWKCSGCKKHVQATKQLTVFRPPLSLCIQFKRFAYSEFMMGGSGGGFGHGRYGNGGRKITKLIEFPAKFKLPLSDKRSCEYQLTGAVVHLGHSATSGHYYAYIKKPGRNGQDRWFRMDDSFVVPVPERKVLQDRDAYLLFYSRTSVTLEFPSPPVEVLGAKLSSHQKMDDDEDMRAQEAVSSKDYNNHQRVIPSLSGKTKPEGVSLASTKKMQRLKLCNDSEKLDQTSIPPDSGMSPIRIQQTTALSDSTKTTEAASSRQQFETTKNSQVGASDEAHKTNGPPGSLDSSRREGESQQAMRVERVDLSIANGVRKRKALKEDESILCRVEAVSPLARNDQSKNKNFENRSSDFWSEPRSEESATTTESSGATDAGVGPKSGIMLDEKHVIKIPPSRRDSLVSDSGISDSRNSVQKEQAQNEREDSFADPMANTEQCQTGFKRTNGNVKQSSVNEMADSRSPTTKPRLPFGTKKKRQSSGGHGDQHALLGNVQTSKWDESNDENNQEQLSRIALERKIAQEESKAKRSMRVDSWDASLDEGRTPKKKQKKQNETSLSSSTENRFQALQTSAQRQTLQTSARRRIINSLKHISRNGFAKRRLSHRGSTKKKQNHR